MSVGASLLDQVRQPEYTGENRCVPCTVTNVAIAAVLGVAVGAAWPPVGAALFVASLAAIWLRGYLVPGTPELTKRYFPDWLLAVFDKGPERATGLDAAPAASDDVPDEPGVHEDGTLDPELVLLEAGVVEPCEEIEDLCLDDGFRTAWRDRMRAIGQDETEREELAAELDLDPDLVDFDEYGGAFVATYDGARAGQWESRAALLADLAAARELPERIDYWLDLPVTARSQLLGGLRIFIDECPDCGGRVEADREVVESCCRSHEVVAATCDSCDSRLLEVPYDEAAAA